MDGSGFEWAGCSTSRLYCVVFGKCKTVTTYSLAWYGGVTAWLMYYINISKLGVCCIKIGEKNWCCR